VPTCHDDVIVSFVESIEDEVQPIRISGFKRA
jgi:hypothetical protein